MYALLDLIRNLDSLPAQRSQLHRVGDGVVSAGSFALGMFPMLTARTLVEQYIYVASVVVTLYGAVSIVWGMWVATHPGAGLLRQLRPDGAYQQVAQADVQAPQADAQATGKSQPRT